MMPIERPSPNVHGGACLSFAKQHDQHPFLYSPGWQSVAFASSDCSNFSNSFTYSSSSSFFSVSSWSIIRPSRQASAFSRLPYRRISFLHRTGSKPNCSRLRASINRMLLMLFSFSWIHRRAAFSFCPLTLFSAITHHEYGTWSSLCRLKIVSSLLGSGAPSNVTCPIFAASTSFTSLRRSCSDEIRMVPTQDGSQSVPIRNVVSSDQRSSIRTKACGIVFWLNSPCFFPSTYHVSTWWYASTLRMIRCKQLFLITPGLEYTPIPQEPSRRTKKEPGCLFVGSVWSRHVYSRDAKSGTTTSMMIE